MSLSAAKVERLPLAPLTTLGVGGEAELWLIEDVRQLPEATQEAYKVLGAGSNLLIGDDGLEERVIKLGCSFNSLAEVDGRLEFWLGAATPLPGLVRRAAELGLSGLEGLLGIPAVLGGAIAMNAGTRFGEIADTLVEVEMFVGGGLERLNAHTLNLSYRHSSLPKGAIITKAKLALSASSPEKVKTLMDKVDTARKGQPKIKSAGCAFKNPLGDSAGRLIDQAGLKGLRVGQAMVSFEHANFIVNLGGAKAADIVKLLALIQEKVSPPLEIEWERWGFKLPLEQSELYDMVDGE
ncbi:MAG: UDP-N-acetylmuramate dehydrogenase [Deinococcales bacterium]